MICGYSQRLRNYSRADSAAYLVTLGQLGERVIIVENRQRDVTTIYNGGPGSQRILAYGSCQRVFCPSILVALDICVKYEESTDLYIHSTRNRHISSGCLPGSPEDRSELLAGL